MSRTIEDVPRGQMDFARAALLANGLTDITVTEQANGLFTVVGRRPAGGSSAGGGAAGSLSRGSGEAAGTTQPASALKPSEAAALYMIGEEAFIPFRYQDVADNATIGYGHHRGLTKDQIDAQFPDGLTEAQAWSVMLGDLDDFSNTVRAKVTVPLAQHQFDALMMVAFGTGNINRMADDVNAGRHAAVAEKIAGITHSNDGVFQPGLARRFANVSAIYREGRYPDPPKTRAQLRASAIQLVERRYPDALNTVGNNFGRPTEPTQQRQAKEAYFRMTGRIP